MSKTVNDMDDEEFSLYVRQMISERNFKHISYRFYKDDDISHLDFSWENDIGIKQTINEEWEG